MAAHYDNYDYPSYWEGRQYEHESEIIALKAFLSQIKKIDSLLEIGAGYGRLTPVYQYRAKKIVLSDPSAKLLKLARDSYKKEKHIKFIHAGAESIKTKIRGKSQDLIILVRVLHHIDDIDQVFILINQLLKDKGYFILEFANKRHFKSRLIELFKGNITFPFDIFPKNLTKKSKYLPFKNYHPDNITNKLEKNGFKIIDKKSVSNVRNPFIKNHVPHSILLSLEKIFQTILSYIDFGPSIFILGQKK